MVPASALTTSRVNLSFALQHEMLAFNLTTGQALDDRDIPPLQNPL